MHITQHSQVCRLFLGLLVISAAWTAPVAVTPHSGGTGTLESDSDSSKSNHLDKDKIIQDSNRVLVAVLGHQESQIVRSTRAWKGFSEAERESEPMFKESKRMEDNSKLNTFFRGVVPPDKSRKNRGVIPPQNAGLQRHNDPARWDENAGHQAFATEDPRYLFPMSGGPEEPPAGRPQQFTHTEDFRDPRSMGGARAQTQPGHAQYPHQMSGGRGASLPNGVRLRGGPQRNVPGNSRYQQIPPFPPGRQQLRPPPGRGQPDPQMTQRARNRNPKVEAGVPSTRREKKGNRGHGDIPPPPPPPRAPGPKVPVHGNVRGPPPPAAFAVPPGNPHDVDYDSDATTSVHSPSDLDDLPAVKRIVGPRVDFTSYGRSEDMNSAPDVEAKRRVRNFVTPSLMHLCGFSSDTELKFRGSYGGTMEDLRKPVQFLLSCSGLIHEWTGRVLGNLGQISPIPPRSTKGIQKGGPKPQVKPPPPPPPPMAKSGGNSGPLGSTSQAGARPSISGTTQVKSGHQLEPPQDTKHGNLPMAPPNPSQHGQDDPPPTGSSSSKADGPPSSKADGPSNSQTKKVESVHDSGDESGSDEDTEDKDKPNSPAATQPKPSEPDQAHPDVPPPSGPSSSPSKAGGDSNSRTTKVESVRDSEDSDESGSDEDTEDKGKPNPPVTQPNPTGPIQAPTDVPPPQSGPSTPKSKAGGPTTKVESPVHVDKSSPHEATKVKPNSPVTQPNPTGPNQPPTDVPPPQKSNAGGPSNGRTPKVESTVHDNKSSLHEATKVPGKDKPNPPITQPNSGEREQAHDVPPPSGPPNSKSKTAGQPKVNSVDSYDADSEWETVDESQPGALLNVPVKVNTQRTGDAPSGAANGGPSTQRLKPDIPDRLPGPPSADLPLETRRLSV
ncbi:hypothetical protein F5880DRAFT_1506094 [Lentinula raphanica]|nr:hypothetical protein F5880DRAFT_1506094 [Lentinula raphanica]